MWLDPRAYGTPPVRARPQPRRSTGDADGNRASFWRSHGQLSPLPLVSEPGHEGRGQRRGHSEYDVDHQRGLVAACYLKDHPAQEGTKSEAEIHESEERSKDETEMLRAIPV